MDDKLKVINFLQDFGCATLKQLQILFNKSNDNLKNIICNTQFAYCVYPDMKILNKRKK